MGAAISRLTCVDFIDVTELTLSIVRGLAKFSPTSTFQSMIIPAILQFMDFFAIETQRTALEACSYLSTVINSENVSNIIPAIPLFINLLSYSDAEIVKLSCSCMNNFIKGVGHNEEFINIIAGSDLIERIFLLLTNNQSGITVTEEIVIICYQILYNLCNTSKIFVGPILLSNITEAINVAISMKTNSDDISLISPQDVQSTIIQSVISLIHILLPNINKSHWDIILKLIQNSPSSNSKTAQSKSSKSKKRKCSIISDETIKSITEAIKNTNKNNSSKSIEEIYESDKTLCSRLFSSLLPLYNHILSLSNSVDYNVLILVYTTVAQLLLTNKDTANILPNDISTFISLAFNTKVKIFTFIYVSVLSHCLEMYDKSILDSIVRMGIIDSLKSMEKISNKYKKVNIRSDLVLPEGIAIEKLIESSTSILLSDINNLLIKNSFEKDAKGNWTSTSMKILLSLIDGFNNCINSDLNRETNEKVINELNEKCIENMKAFVRIFKSGLSISPYEIKKSNLLYYILKYLTELPPPPSPYDDKIIEKDYERRRNRIDSFVRIIMNGDDLNAFSTIISGIQHIISTHCDFQKDLPKTMNENEILHLVNTKMQIQFFSKDENLNTLPQMKSLCRSSLGIDAFLSIATAEGYVLDRLQQSSLSGSSGSNSSSPYEIHTGSNGGTCDECGCDIDIDGGGVRYRCNECDNYNLCQHCYIRKDSIHDDEHEFTKIEKEKLKKFSPLSRHLPFKDKKLVLQNIKLKIHDVEADPDRLFIDYAMKMDWSDPNEVWSTVHTAEIIPIYDKPRTEKKPIIQLFKTEFTEEELTIKPEQIIFTPTNPLDSELKNVIFPPPYNWTDSMKIALSLLKTLVTINRHLDIYHSITFKDDCTYYKLSIQTINEKIVSIFQQQVRDPIVVFKRPPIWCEFIVDNFPFLLTIEMKKLYCDILSLDTKRSLLSILQTYSQFQNKQNLPFNLNPMLLTVSRSKAILTAMELFKLHLHNKFEFRFSGEEGTGDGPTSEFYSIISKEIQSKELGLWHDLSITPTGRDDELPLWKQQLSSIFNPLTASKYHRCSAFICSKCNYLFIPCCLKHKQLYIDLRDEHGNSIYIYIYIILFILLLFFYFYSEMWM